MPVTTTRCLKLFTNQSDHKVIAHSMARVQSTWIMLQGLRCLLNLQKKCATKGEVALMSIGYNLVDANYSVGTDTEVILLSNHPCTYKH